MRALQTHRLSFALTHENVASLQDALTFAWRSGGLRFTRTAGYSLRTLGGFEKRVCWRFSGCLRSDPFSGIQRFSDGLCQGDVRVRLLQKGGMAVTDKGGIQVIHAIAASEHDLELGFK